MIATVDVVVVGAGPAGAVAALNLARGRAVLLVERRDRVVRIGESLVPAARGLLADMGLLAALEAGGHAPWFGNHVRWGAEDGFDVDFLRGPDGPGWHLDRARFETWLQREAVARGARLVRASVGDLQREGPGWRLTLTGRGGAGELRARAVIDAGGRSSPVSRRLGARRTIDERLVCGWAHGLGDGPGQTTLVAEPDGWWYSAPLPAGRCVLAFHTDADLPAAHDARDASRLLARAAAVPQLASILARTDFTGPVVAGVAPAHGAVLEPFAGPGWAAVGDAALGFDPLSSQGLFNALYTGLAAAEAVARHLDGDPSGLADYARQLAEVRAAYLRHRDATYAGEQRWSSRSFWARRHLRTPRARQVQENDARRKHRFGPSAGSPRRARVLDRGK